MLIVAYIVLTSIWYKGTRRPI